MKNKIIYIYLIICIIFVGIQFLLPKPTLAEHQACWICKIWVPPHNQCTIQFDDPGATNCMEQSIEHCVTYGSLCNY